jgi:hypothetical protein
MAEADLGGRSGMSLSQHFPVSAIPWPSIGKKSPHREAYNDSLKQLGEFEWVTFVDIDEFIVPWGYANINEYLALVPPDVGSVAMNWRIFGSSGVDDANYRSVLRTFTRASDPRHGYQRHFKTVSRLADIKEVHVHDVDLLRGRLSYSDFSELQPSKRGTAEYPKYSGIQVNHYQCKTFAEFKKRMSLGNPNHPPGEGNTSRLKDLEIRFKALDQNIVVDSKINKFLDHAEEILEKMIVLSAPPQESLPHGG